jgi:hypothetical protein
MANSELDQLAMWDGLAVQLRKSSLAQGTPATLSAMQVLATYSCLINTKINKTTFLANSSLNKINIKINSKPPSWRQLAKPKTTMNAYHLKTECLPKPSIGR